MTRRNWTTLLVSLVGLGATSACGSSNSAPPDHADAGSDSTVPDSGSPGDSSAHVDSTVGDSGGPDDSGTPGDSTVPGDSSTPLEASAGDAAAGPPAVGSGGFGVVTVNGKQKLYLPTTKTNAAGNSVVSVVDVGVVGNGIAGAPALITDVDLGTSHDVGIMAAGDSTMVLVGSGTTRTIWIIDPQTDTLTKTIALDPSTLKTGSFSSNSVQDTYMNGIAIDSQHRLAYIAQWNGFAVFDMNTMTITSTILANPSENFALDVTHQKLYAPFYDCSTSGEGTLPPTCVSDAGPFHTITNGLSVIDLTDGTVYSYRDPAAITPTSPLGTNPDQAAVDPATQLVIVADEISEQYAIDFSQAVFDTAAATVTAPHQLISTGLSTTGPGGLDGVTIEPSKHFAFFEAEGANSCIGGLSIDVALLDLSSYALGAPYRTCTGYPCPPSDGGAVAASDLCAASGGTTITSVAQCASENIPDPVVYGLCCLPAWSIVDIDGGFYTSPAQGATVAGYITSVMPNPPSEAGAPCSANGTYWGNPVDPHAVTGTQGIVGGRSVAFLLDLIGSGPNDAAFPEHFGPYHYIARIDLETMATLTGASPGYLTAAELTPALTYLDVQTLEQ